MQHLFGGPRMNRCANLQELHLQSAAGCDHRYNRLEGYHLKVFPGGFVPSQAYYEAAFQNQISALGMTGFGENQRREF